MNRFLFFSFLLFFSTVIFSQSSTSPVYRINAGGGSVTNSIGTFAADAYYSPTAGNTYSTATAIAATSNGVMYQTERYGTNGTFSYAFPVSNGSYTVILHFAEIYWQATNKRLFDVSIEGNKVLDNYDIFKKAGAFTATTETFAVNVTDGMLNLYFSSLASDGGVDQPKVSAIEIMNASSASTGTQSVSSYTLINASNNQDIQTISNGATINLATLVSRSVNIRANTSPATVGSVVFNLSGAQSRTQTETAAPYALFGDNNGVYVAWTPVVGSYTLAGTPYTASSGTGVAGTPLSISFRVVDSAVVSQNSTPPPPTITADDNANTLAASSSLGSSEILVSVNGGAYAQYTGTINVGNINAAASYWQFKIKSAAGRNESSVVGSPAFTTSAGNAGLVTIKATYATAPANPAATFADLGNNKRIAFMFTKDDGGIGDYTSVYPVINGGTSSLNGVTYPGFTYSDGAGGTRKWGYTFAINGRGNALKDGSNSTVTTWNMYRQMLANTNLILSNHSADHTNTPTALYQLQLNDSIVKAQLGVDMRTVVLPSGLPGFVAAGIQLADILWSSEGYGGPGNASADGYDSEISWGDTYDLPTLGNKHLIGSRHNFDGQFIAGIVDAKAWVDSKFQQAENANHKQVFSAFSHFPATASETTYFEQVMSYIKDHPKNHEDVWFPNLQQFAEYLEVKKLAVKSNPSVSGNVVTYTIDLSAVRAKNKYKDMSLILTGGTLQNVEVSGADSYDFNVTTGLVNIYKGSQVIGAKSSAAITTRTTAQELVIPQPNVNTAKAYPNPGNSGKYTIPLPQKLRGEVVYSLVSSSGARLTGGQLLTEMTTSFLNFDFSKHMKSSGQYYLVLQGKEMKTQVKLMLIK